MYNISGINIDNNYVEFFNLLKKILPSNLEKVYVDLLNKTTQYIKAGKQKEIDQKQLDAQKLELNIKLKEISDEITLLLKKKKELVDHIALKQGLIEKYKKFPEKFKDIINEMEAEVANLNKDIADIDATIKIIEERKKRIKSEISNIEEVKIFTDKNKEELETEISNLLLKTNEDEYNIENCKILFSNLNEFKKLNLNDKQKKYLADTFSLFLQIRIECYKLLKEMVPSILNEQVDNDMSYNYELIIYILSTVDINKMYLNIVSSNFEEVDYVLNLLRHIKNYMLNTKERIFPIEILKTFENSDYSKLASHLLALPSNSRNKR